MLEVQEDCDVWEQVAKRLLVRLLWHWLSIYALSNGMERFSEPKASALLNKDVAHAKWVNKEGFTARRGIYTASEPTASGADFSAMRASSEPMHVDHAAGNGPDPQEHYHAHLAAFKMTESQCMGSFLIVALLRQTLLRYRYSLSIQDGIYS